jgi:oligo-1,6-glucosidase
VRREVYDIMKFWLDKGVDGFRMDVINMISKVPELPNGEPKRGKKYASGKRYYMNGPRVHEFLQEMNREVLSKYDIMTVGETPGVTPKEGILYTDPSRHELNMVFQFEHVGLDSGPGGKWDIRPWSLADLKKTMTKWQKELERKGWNSLYLNNHDQPRAVSRFGDDGKYRVESAKMLATFLHMMQGTPYIYQGEEIGMTNVRFPSIEYYRDIETLNMYKERVEEYDEDPQKVMEKIYYKGRDNARTPMQWDDSENAGFTTGTPWISVNPNYKEINVKAALADPNSVFHYYKKLIQLRKQHDVIVYGTYDLILEDDPYIYAYTRTLGNEKLIVITNFSEKTPVFRLPDDITYKTKELLISNYDVDETEELKEIRLRPWEARVYKIRLS